MAQHFTTDEVIHFVMDIPGDGVESSKENMFREEGDAEVDPANVNGGDSDYPEESVEEANKPSTLRSRGCDLERKMQCGSGCGGGRGVRRVFETAVLAEG